ncbi:Aca2/YdiL-like domain-containing protein [Corynebacterium flavescens]|uniref:Aca2/YdiL-like domain-containing protein n=1 Tax=Corynebacterium flavescens TaxID=28028 RepID=UPI003FD3BAC4
MNSAEFRVLRTSLGLTCHDVATANEVALRTAQRWESTHQPPADVQAWILDKWETVATRVGEVLDLAEAGEMMHLVSYRDDATAFQKQGMSASEHAALIGHICMALTQCDFDFDIIPAP